MRGTHPKAAFDLASQGIIPAYAGNTIRRKASWHFSADHPRVCGEHSRLAPEQQRDLGSSPRMRGTHA